jgi:hypothetical protein
MTLKIKLIITACLTAFLAVIVGAVINKVSAVQQTQTAAAIVETAVPAKELAPTEPIPLPTMTIASVVDLAVVQQREAAYQAQLAEANLRLAEASARLAEAQGQAKSVAQQYNAVVNSQVVAPTAVPVPTDAPGTTTTVYLPVDAVAAIGRALDADAVLQKAPELVLYESRAAYELVFDRGTVYIAADDGSVLGNGMAGFQVVSATTNTGSNPSPATPPAVPQPTTVPAPTSEPAPDDSGNDRDGDDDNDNHEAEHVDEDSHD